MLVVSMCTLKMGHNYLPSEHNMVAAHELERE